MKFDLHIHTNRHSPDSVLDPFVLCGRARAIGLDGIVITEHDWLWTEPELDELRAAHPGLIILAGVEVSTLEGHFLAYGVTDPFPLRRGIGVAKLCRAVHNQGGAVVAAHPFRWGQPFQEILDDEKPDLDGLEMMSSNMDEACRGLALRVQQARGWPGLGNSDAHDEATVGFCYTEFAVEVRNNAELVRAIRQKQTAPRERNGK